MSNTTTLDPLIALKKAFDDTNESLRVTTAATVSGATEVIISHADDSIRIGDGTITEVSTLVNNTAYNATSWNGDTAKAPSKDAVRDQIETMQTSISSKEPSITAGTTSQYWRGDKSWQTLDKTAVGLSNVDNTSDANKPVSTATQTALNGKEASLGNPADENRVLTSTTGGTRSWSRLMKLFDPTRISFFFDDFIAGTTAQLGWVASAAGAGGAGSQVNIGVTPAAGRPGQFRFETGTTATGRASLNQSGSALLVGGGEIEIQMALIISNAPTAAQDYVLRVGLGDNVTAESTDAVYFWISSASANWQIKTRNNAVETTANCGIAYSTASFQTLKITINAAATSVTFSVNGTNCTAPITTNIPSGATRNLGPMLYMQKTVGTTNAMTQYDYYMFRQEFTSAR